MTRAPTIAKRVSVTLNALERQPCAPPIAKRTAVTLNVLERPVCVPLIHKRANVTLFIVGSRSSPPDQPRLPSEIDPAGTSTSGGSHA